jgi:hypothetical protein
MPLGGLATAGLIVGGLGAVGKSIMGISQMNKANQIKPEWSAYKQNPLAAQNLGAVKNLYYGRSPAFTQAEANIKQAQSNQMANAQRNATDSATLLAVGAGGASQAQSSLSNLAGQESQQKVGVLDNLSRAYAMSIAEGDKEQANKIMKYQLDSQAQSDLRKSGIGNIFGGISDLAGGMIGAGQLGGGGSANADYASMLKGYNSTQHGLSMAEPQYMARSARPTTPTSFTGSMPNISQLYTGIGMQNYGR